jgi:hypothetical protein
MRHCRLGTTYLKLRQCRSCSFIGGSREAFGGRRQPHAQQCARLRICPSLRLGDGGGGGHRGRGDGGNGHGAAPRFPSAPFPTQAREPCASEFGGSRQIGLPARAHLPVSEEVGQH